MKIPSWGWVVLAGLALLVAYQRGWLKSLGVGAPSVPAVQKDPVAPPAAGTNAADVINNAVSGIFGLARQLVPANTNVPTT